MKTKSHMKNFYWYLLSEMKTAYFDAESLEEKHYYIGIIQMCKIFANMFHDIILPEYDKILFTDVYDSFMVDQKLECGKCDLTCEVNNFRLATSECFTSDKYNNFILSHAKKFFEKKVS